MGKGDELLRKKSILMDNTIRAEEPFVVMVKPTGSLCNMTCSYCYYNTGHSEGIMTGETLELFIKQYIEAAPGPAVSFIWHGGEPTLAGPAFFKKVVELQKKYLPDGWSCWNNLQTNGLLLDDGWCEFLQKNRFDVGISIDGDERSHNFFRRSQDDSAVYVKTAESIERLKSRGIKPDLLCTVNSVTVKEPLKVYRALREFNTGWIQFIPVVNNAEGKLTVESVTPKEYGRFLCDIFDEWVLHDFCDIDIQLFSEILRVYTGGSAALCYIAPVCGQSIVADWDGRIYSCDHFVDSRHYLGDIHKMHLGEIVRLPAQTAFGRRKQDRLPEECRKCDFLHLCNGGCPKDRLIVKDDGEYPQNILCEGLMQFYSYIMPVVQVITSLRKRHISSAGIMKVLRDEVRRIWKDVKRNDPCPCGSGKKAKNCCWYKRI